MNIPSPPPCPKKRVLDQDIHPILFIKSIFKNNPKNSYKSLVKACGGSITPRPLAERISSNPKDFTEIEKWLASNYLTALSLIDLYKIRDKIELEMSIKPMVNTKYMIDQLRKIKAINEALQLPHDLKTPQWNSHETIDDIIHDLLTKLGD